MRFHFRWKPDFSAVKQRWRYCVLCAKSLTYNEYSSASDVIFEPIITIVDFTARWFGFAFVSLVILLTSYVVIAYYMVAIPYIQKNYWGPRAMLTIAYGHYLLVMIIFHYYKGVRTEPGRPPKDASEVAVTSVCKRCILPKPPRTHHCSVCRSCVLKMDHHCPWINNCVGHYNHRYFILFCVFMWLGTFFVMTTTWPLFHDCFEVKYKMRYTVDSIYDFFGKRWKTDDVDDKFAEDDNKSDIDEGKQSNGNNLEIFSHQVNFKVVNAKRVMPGSIMPDLCRGKDNSYKNHVIFLWLLCTAVTAALGTLTMIQISLVSKGETSIEKLINGKELKKAKKGGKVFINPYNLGLVENWKILLDFRDFKSFCRKVLLPSTAPPIGDGIAWDRYTKKFESL